MKKIVIIVAGGSGTRIKSDVPKQFLLIAGIPILYLTIKKFWNYDNSIEIIVVLPEKYQQYWRKQCKELKLKIKHKIRTGGETRFHSVKNALIGIKPGAIVAVHDAVRPLVSKETIRKCFLSAEKKGAVIPVIDVNETLRMVNGKKNYVVNRDDYKLVQTPQVFKSEILLEAYKQEYSQEFTDDALVIENIGFTVNLIKGNKDNIKITTCEDLVIAESIFKDTQYHL